MHWMFRLCFTCIHSSYMYDERVHGWHVLYLYDEWMHVWHVLYLYDEWMHVWHVLYLYDEWMHVWHVLYQSDEWMHVWHVLYLYDEWVDVWHVLYLYDNWVHVWHVLYLYDERGPATNNLRRDLTEWAVLYAHDLQVWAECQLKGQIVQVRVVIDVQRLKLAKGTCCKNNTGLISV